VSARTGPEPPLRPEDVRAGVQVALGNWRGEALLSGGDLGRQVRTDPGGCCGWPTEHYSVSVDYDRSGLFIRATEHADARTDLTRPRRPPIAVRAGHITWQAAEAMLREGKPGQQQSLF
jgi:hypothetical protein